VNLIAPTAIFKLAPEYGRLTTDLVTQVGNINALATAKETAAQPDISVLSQATGWDGRLIALASHASRLSADTGMSHDALYGLLRAGLPTDAQQLALIGPDAVQLALARAVEAGIVSLDASQTAAATAAYKMFARATLMTLKAPGAASTFGELLSSSGAGSSTSLTDTEKTTFADIYLSHRGTPAELWQKVRDGGIPEPKVSALRVQGKLAHLTHNSAPLMAQLALTVTSVDSDRSHRPDDRARRDFARPESCCGQSTRAGFDEERVGCGLHARHDTGVIFSGGKCGHGLQRHGARRHSAGK
jgi:hypothetical protein